MVTQPLINSGDSHRDSNPFLYNAHNPPWQSLKYTQHLNTQTEWFELRIKHLLVLCHLITSLPAIIFGKTGLCLAEEGLREADNMLASLSHKAPKMR